MNFTKIIIVFTIFGSTVAAMGSRPAAAEAYLMLTKSDYFRAQLTSKLGHTNRAVLKQRIENAKLRADIFNLLNRQSTALAHSVNNNTKSNRRMNRFRRFHS